MDSIRAYHLKEKRLVGRDSFTVAFFTEGPYERIRSGIPEVFEYWCREMPEAALQWADIGSSGGRSWKAYNKSILTKARNQIDPEKAKGREWVLLEIMGGNKEEACPDFYLVISGKAEDELIENEGSFVEMRFPYAFPGLYNHDKFVEFISTIADKLVYTSGYASPSLMLDSGGNEAYQRAGGKQLYPLLKKHPGYDVSDNHTAELGKKCRGARWLTLLGTELLEQLGGKEKLAAQLDPRIELIENRHGLMIRAGKEPELGDLDNGEHLPLIQSVARAIEPVTTFDEIAPFNGFVPASKVEKECARWSRRFL